MPRAPFNTFISGDGNDKCFVWNVRPKKSEGEEAETSQYECVKVGELEGHTETVEFIKFNHDGKYCVTGGMNNVLRIWELEEEGKDGDASACSFSVKCKLENGPSETDDILFVEWHPKGNALICGGKDYSIWLMNALSGDFLACFSGH